MHVPENLVKEVSVGLGIEGLNEVQLRLNEAAATEADILLLSPTGTGKTLGFLLQALAAYGGNWLGGTQALIIVPTRELALQVMSVFKKMTVRHRVVAVYGGHSIETEENALKEPPFLLIGTPGRLCDHMRRGNVATGQIKMLVIDEFDKSLDMGFDEEMSFALATLTGLERRIYTSATDMDALPEYASVPGLAKVDLLRRTGNEVPGLAVRVLHIGAADKGDALVALLCHIGRNTSIVYAIAMIGSINVSGAGGAGRGAACCGRTGEHHLPRRTGTARPGSDLGEIQERHLPHLGGY